METESQNKPKVLVIEDDPGHQRLLELYIQRSGCVCQTAFDGKTGLQMALDNIYDLMFIDMNIPELDGFVVAMRLREAECDTPLIGISALKVEEIKQNAIKVGYNDFLQKPFQQPEIEELLKKHIPALRHETV